MKSAASGLEGVGGSHGNRTGREPRAARAESRAAVKGGGNNVYTVYIKNLWKNTGGGFHGCRFFNADLYFFSVDFPVFNADLSFFGVDPNKERTKKKCLKRERTKSERREQTKVKHKSNRTQTH